MLIVVKPFEDFKNCLMPLPRVALRLTLGYVVQPLRGKEAEVIKCVRGLLRRNRRRQADAEMWEQVSASASYRRHLRLRDNLCETADFGLSG